MPSANSSGNQRGVSPLAQSQLKDAREKRRAASYQKPAKRNPPAAPQVLSFPKLLKGPTDKLHERIRKFVELAETEPGALTATVIGTLLAELDQANGTLKKMWKWLDTFLDGGGEAKDENVVKLMGELRKWAETLQAAALKVAEIQARGLSQRESDPLDAYRTNEEDNALEVEAECQDASPSVTIDSTPQEADPNNQPHDEAASQ